MCQATLLVQLAVWINHNMVLCVTVQGATTCGGARTTYATHLTTTASWMASVTTVPTAWDGAVVRHLLNNVPTALQDASLSPCPMQTNHFAA